jgi:hypothetical protein
LFEAILAFVHRITEMLQLRPEQVWTVHLAEARDTTAPLSSSHSSSFCCNRTSTHKPHTHDFSWVPHGLQIDIDRDWVMVNIDTSILITNPNLNDFQIKMNSVFNTISEWFMVNSLSLNLNKTFYGIKVFRMHKYIIHFMMGCKRRESCRHLFRKLKILPLPCQYILPLLLFIINNRKQFTTNSEIHSINSRQFNSFINQGLIYPSTKRDSNTGIQNCGSLVYV